VDSCRRNFLKKFAYSTIAIPFGIHFNRSLFAEIEKVPDKEALRILNDRPLNMEASQDLLDDEITPTDKMFVRNNGIVPSIAYEKNIKDWRLTIDGEVEKPLQLSIEDLKAKFKLYTYQLVLECGGNGRAAFYPKTEGTQWTYGGVGCPLWEGVRLRDILDHVKVKKSAVYVAYYSHDLHLSGDPQKPPISRGFPITKGLDEMTLLVLEMNGKPLPPLHGYPARLLCPGYPASASGKWLKRLWIRDQIHDGPKMTGKSYRIPSYPIAPGTEIPEKDFKIIEEMPVKSIISFPKSGTHFAWSIDRKFYCRGFAWSGSGDIHEVHVSYNFGQTWIRSNLKKPRNTYAWQRWEASFVLPSKGYYEIWARATDKKGNMQPMLTPGWNPEGYLNNAMPRIACHAEV
jgi:DMSO/TMAO reductase YedYZ molybdopterin-dependent catalytic subunit